MIEPNLNPPSAAPSDCWPDRTDFEIQIEAARLSIGRGHYATARAELRGAMLVLSLMEKQAEGRPA